ncbi:hypothetical protein QMK19_39445 [Streptomyces sp. H10-C2]|uniref:hypothetical protein n=1 Tax=unclassified Streptomyces TaxID=2593676 RepID=UPI0024BA5076|nr:MULTISPECIES: hypothetical protein [unclassified Streptomyces]MDJ0347270.1 hypothetical protein [Streptomyces sp. PH10-H1]MDJ0375504.1 hypothetical protein [Streptomyces sp. H10-C2]
MPLPARTHWTALLVLCALALTGCGSSAGRTGALDTASDSKKPTCRAHQSLLPSRDYTAGSNAKTLAVLGMMKYYTAKRTLRFCDGKPATTQDTAWTQLYTDLTKP